MPLAFAVFLVLPALVCTDDGDRVVESRRPPTNVLKQAARAPLEPAKLGNVSPIRSHAFSAVGVGEAIEAPNGCVTRADPRAQAWFSVAAPVGSKCLFKVDPRDEGTHCIPELQYGSNGWCFTKADKSEWGSCGDDCSLYGPPSVLGSIIDVVNQNIDDLMPKVDAAADQGASAAPAAAAQPTDSAKKPAEAASAAPEQAAAAAGADAKKIETNKAALQEAKMSAMVAAKEQKEAEYATKIAAVKAAEALLDVKGKAVQPLAPQANIDRKTAAATAAQALLGSRNKARQDTTAGGGSFQGVKLHKDVSLMQLKTARLLLAEEAALVEEL